MADQKYTAGDRAVRDRAGRLAIFFAAPQLESKNDSTAATAADQQAPRDRRPQTPAGPQTPSAQQALTVPGTTPVPPPPRPARAIARQYVRA
jgi:hypothetical protein